MNLEDRKNYEYCQKTLAFKDRIEKDFLALGKHLYNIRENRLYEPHWSSFHEFAMELKMSISSVSKLINIYRIYVLEYHYQPDELAKAGGWTVLAETLPHVTSQEAAGRVLTLAMELSRSDLKKELTEAKTGVQMISCPHEDSYAIRVCRTCGDRHQIYEKEE